jgi:phosphoribosyl-ATP pyrophosphohydrolase
MSDGGTKSNHPKSTLINEKFNDEGDEVLANTSKDFVDEETVMEDASDLAYFLYGQL